MLTLEKLSDVLEKRVVKRDVYDELVKIVNPIQTTNTSNLVKKAEYNTKIAKIENKIFDHNHDEYITTQGFNELTTEYFTARLAKAKFETKADIADFVKKTNFDKKLKKLIKKLLHTYRGQKKLNELLVKNKITSTEG